MSISLPLSLIIRVFKFLLLILYPHSKKTLHWGEVSWCPKISDDFLSAFWDFEGMDGLGINKTNCTCHECYWGLFINKSDRCPRVEWETGGVAIFRHELHTPHEAQLPVELWPQPLNVSSVHQIRSCRGSRTLACPSLSQAQGPEQRGCRVCLLPHCTCWQRAQDNAQESNFFYHNRQPQASSQRIVRDFTELIRLVKN